MAGLSLSLLLVVGLLTWAVIAPRDGDDPYRAQPAPGAPATTQPGAAATQLQRLEQAVRRGDPAAAAALAPAEDPGAQQQLRALVDNARAARIISVRLRYIDESGGLEADRTWLAAVGVTWRYAGFDDAAARTEVSVRFRVGAEDVEIAGIGSADLRTPVWMSGPLDVRRTARTLVLAAPGNLPVETYAALAARAVPIVSAVLADWKPRLVVEVPADVTALERALGVEPDYYTQIAAVTGSADGSTAPGSPVHVYVNPDVFDTLGRAGQEVVLDHEAAHVAGDGPRSRAPTWLVEGFADYVALRETALPLRKTAAQVRARVRRDGLPTALPGTADFDTRGPHLGAVYESAWLICETLADRGGQDALTRFYADAGDGDPIAGLLERYFSWSESDLLAAWQRRLTSLSGPLPDR